MREFQSEDKLVSVCMYHNTLGTSFEGVNYA